MFTLGSEEEFEWPVTIRLAQGSGGKFADHTFVARFRRLTQTRLKQFLVQAQAGEIDDILAVREIMLGWKEVIDRDGKELPFTEANLARLLDIATVAACIAQAYFDAMSGGGKRKN